MKTTIGAVYDAVLGLHSIADASRPRMIPQLGKFRLAKMLMVLERHHALIELSRAKLVQELGSEMFADEAKTQSKGWSVPENSEAYTIFVQRWNKLREEELEVEVKTIPLGALGNDPRGIEVGEFKLLGSFVEDNDLGVA